MQTPQQEIRDAGLRRLATVTRTLTVTAVVSAGVLVDVVTHTAYGRAHTRLVGSVQSTGAAQPAGAAAPASSAPAPDDSNPSDDGQGSGAAPPAQQVQPVQQVQPTVAPPVVQSGGS